MLSKAGKQQNENRNAHESSRRITDEAWAIVDTRLAEAWSPEQISGHLKANDRATVSYEAICQRIYADKRAGGIRLQVKIATFQPCMLIF